MINQKSIDAVNRASFSKQFRRPLYDSYCFSNIPGTVEKLLCGTTDFNTLPQDVLGYLPASYDKVVLFFVDAFGWRFFEKYKDKYPFLQHVIQQGVASKITSEFPSTTASHVTTIHTGQRVDESGVFEWNYYEPTPDAVISPLMFSFADDDVRDTLKSVNADPKSLFPTRSFYQKLGERGVKTYLYQSRDFTPSPYGDAVTIGVDTTVPFDAVAGGLTHLQQSLIGENGKTYFYFYFGQIDTMGHKHGPSSPQFEAEADVFFDMLERLLYGPVVGKCGKTLLLMTADHGQVDIDPQTTVYLNKEIPEISLWTQTNRNGELIVPGGSCRDFFLYIKEEYLKEAEKNLTRLLEGKAEVYRVNYLMNEGFFGDAPSELLKSRVGNLCILPYDHESVWWWEEGRFEQSFYGHHGGLTPEEMETTFLALPLQ